MSRFVSTLSAWWTALATHARSMLLLPDPEPADYGFVASDIARYRQLRADPAAPALDDATWKDLLLAEYSALLGQEVSIFGQQELQRRLRTVAGADASAAQVARVRALMADPARLAALHLLCKPLRHADCEIATLLYQEARAPAPWWAGHTWPLPLLLLGSMAAVIVTPLAWLLTFGVAFILMREQMRYHERVERWQRSMTTLQLLLKVCSLLAMQDDASLALAQFRAAAKQAGKINRGLSRSPMVELTPGARAYTDWFMLENVNHYCKGVALVHDKLDFLRDCFERVAELEADIALARHLGMAGTFCWAERRTEPGLELAHVVHPLLPAAQPLTLTLRERGAFISGQNGVGKSTLLRTVGINLVAANAFGFCYAARASLPALPVYASMQSEDALLGGESLYMAELRRAQELLAAAEGPHPGMYLIDEIFRGTNHLESVSAAAAVLDVLATEGLVIVSSHNLVLAPLLAHRLDALCVRLDDTGALVLAPGVLAHTNGIALLAQRGLGGAIEAKAGRVCDWLSGYLAHPDDCSAVLAP